MSEPMSPFGKMLFDTAKACQGRPAVVLHDVLTAKVRAWAEEQKADDLASVTAHSPPPVLPWESAQ